MARYIGRFTEQRNISILSRIWSGKKTESPVQSEANIKAVLAEKFPKAKAIEVQDVSGGCGAMFEVLVEAPDFKGLTTIKQHRLITDTLREQIKDMHGIRIQTRVPK